MRVQDHSGDCEEALRHKLGDQEGYFYVCGNAKVVSGAKEKLERILGLEMWKKVQMRILEETF
jgi:sulfite reductase alpha subunit-like flavoprotein